MRKLMLLILINIFLISCAKPEVALNQNLDSQKQILNSIAEQKTIAFQNDVITSNSSFELMESKVKVKENDEKTLFFAVYNMEDREHRFRLYSKKCQSLGNYSCSSINLDFKENYFVNAKNIEINPIKISLKNSPKTVFKYVLLLENLETGQSFIKYLDLDVT
jgi:uncharacterized protein YcfL